MPWNVYALAADQSDKLCRITDGLYLSSQYPEKRKELLVKKGVTHILQVGNELQPSHPPSEFEYLRVDLQDSDEADIVVHLPTCFAFIDKGRQAGAVLVHCAAGVSRSASMCIAYLMARQQLPYYQAKAAVEAVRPTIYPNVGFVLQLQQFERAGCSTAGWVPWSRQRFREARLWRQPQPTQPTQPVHRKKTWGCGLCF